MKLLQQQLIATKKELSESLEHQHEAKLRAIKLDEEKTKYAKDLKEIEEFTLEFQGKANGKIVEMEKKYENVVVSKTVTHISNAMKVSLKVRVRFL